MKKIILFSALLSGAMAFTSCADKLDIEQKATSSTDSFYKTDADAESAVNAMYATFNSEIGGTEGIWNAYIMGLNYSSDDVFAAGGGIDDHADFRILNEFRYQKNSSPISTLYNHIYKSIYSANLVISYFGQNADTPTKKRAVAEARVMRAWMHMLAAQVFYQPPLIDHLITTEYPVNAESQKAIFDFCIKDCEDAIADLPERSSQYDKEGAWRVTQGFARFIGGKSALFANENEKCVTLMKPLVESKKYALVPGERFRDLFHLEGDGCEEKIFEFNFSGNTSAAGGPDAWRYGNNRGRWMVANVLNWRGDDIKGGGKSPLICSTGGWGGGSINHEFAHKMLANDGDSYRRKATFLTSDEFFYDEKLCGWLSDEKCTTRDQKEYDPDRGITNTGGSFARSDVMEVKMMMHPNDAYLPVGDNCNQTNMCIARLGEAYLIYAEACLATNKTDEALKYVNEIQKRAGSKTVSTSVNLQTIQDEKQYELWFEGCRWFDIVRWGIAKECYDKVLDNIPYQKDEYWTSNGAKPHKLVYDVRHPWADAKVKLEFIKGKHEYWPIPQSIMDVNPEMRQVRGWAE